MDYAGLDVQYNAGLYLAEALHPDYAPSEALEVKVKAGQLGRKTGKGFLDWSQGKPCINTTKATDKVDPVDMMAVQINEATKLIEIGVCTAEDIGHGYYSWLWCGPGTCHGLCKRVGPFSACKASKKHSRSVQQRNLSAKFDDPTRNLQMIDTVLGCLSIKIR